MEINCGCASRPGPGSPVGQARAVKRLLSHLESGRFGRNLSLSFIQMVVESGFLTLAVLVVANLFGAQSFGRLGVYLSAVQFITMVLDGLVAAVLKRTAEERGGGNHSVKVVLHRLGLSAAVTLPLSLATLLTWKFVEPELTSTAMGLALLVALTRVSKMVLETIFRGRNDFTTPARAGVFLALPYAGLLIVAAILGYRTSTYLTITAAYQLVNSILLLVKVDGRVERKRNTEADSIALLRYSAPLMFRGAIGFLYLKVNTPILAHFATDTEVGYFRLAEQFLNIPLLLIGSVLSAFGPRVAEYWKNGEMEALTTLTAKVYGVLIVLMGAMTLVFVLSEIFIRPFFPSFVPTASILKVFSMVLVLQGLAYAGSVLLVQTEFAGTATWLSVLAGALNLALVFVALWAGGGAVGAAIGTAVAHAVISCIVIVAAHRSLQIPFQIRFS